MPRTPTELRPFLFAFFVVSGFCSLVCQVVWLRLSMASFGVTTPVISLLLSVFMGGLALGSWAAGAWTRTRGAGAGRALAVYGFAEWLIASSALVVPPGFRLGRHLLAVSGAGDWGSGLYHLGVAAWLGLLLLPFCAAMGATFPLALQALRVAEPGAEARGFSRLYLANVVGATLGTVLAALVLIETLGLAGTLRLGAVFNLLLGAAALVLAARRSAGSTDGRALDVSPAAPERTDHGPAAAGERRLLAILFTTGFVSLGMEVLWIRLLTPYLGNLVYSFAIILSVYLTATFVGAGIYRRSRRLSGGELVSGAWPWVAVMLAAMLPIVLADPRLPLPWGLAGGAMRAALGIGPFCLLLGALTPMVVDRLTGGDPERTGRAYAVNVVGGILGPLMAGFVLAPRLPEAWALLALGALPLGFAIRSRARGGSVRGAVVRFGAASIGLAVGCATVVLAKSFEQTFDGAIVRRDHTATVAALTATTDKRLLVNGIGMTTLTPITKMMAHLPLALLDHQPRRGLVICFGMGTSFRSMRRWGIDTTAVELVPSVPELFGEFHRDGPGLLESPEARVVIDDGRRFLEYDDASYDVIVIDPPPPIEAAGSSLLYSVEFYRAARRRLAPGGIVQQWIPSAEPRVLTAMVRAFDVSFPHRAAFRGLDGWGWHLLGSDRPIGRRTAIQLAARMPGPARVDLVEWGPERRPRRMFERVLAKEVPFERILSRFPDEPPLTDDRPLNEYFALRHLRRRFADRAQPAQPPPS